MLVGSVDRVDIKLMARAPRRGRKQEAKKGTGGSSKLYALEKAEERELENERMKLPLREERRRSVEGDKPHSHLHTCGAVTRTDT